MNGPLGLRTVSDSRIIGMGWDTTSAQRAFHFFSAVGDTSVTYHTVGVLNPASLFRSMDDLFSGVLCGSIKRYLSFHERIL